MKSKCGGWLRSVIIISYLKKERKGGIKTGREEEREVMKKIENLTESYRDGETKWELDRGRQGQRQRESIR